LKSIITSVQAVLAKETFVSRKDVLEDAADLSTFLCVSSRYFAMLQNVRMIRLLI